MTEYYLAIVAGLFMLAVMLEIGSLAVRLLFIPDPRRMARERPSQPVCIAGSCDPEYHLTGYRPEQQAELPEPDGRQAIQSGRQAPALPEQRRAELPNPSRPALGSGEREKQIVTPARRKARHD